VAIEDIFKALEEQADAECEGILEQAKGQAGGIVADAEAEAESIKERRVADADAAARSRSSHALNTARLEGKKGVAALKGREIEDTFTSSRQALTTVRGRADYAELFEALASEALAGVDGEFDLLVDPADEALGRDTLAKLGRQATVKPELETAGGVVVTTHGGRVARRNTLEDRLDKVRHVAQADVARILFD
jgi:V/A-type H+-transporting ATPase subunit E